MSATLAAGITTIDGVDIAWTRRGVGDPIVLVHGFTGSQLDWADVVDPLADGGREVITIDHRGHGLSTNTGQRAGYRLSRLAADLGAVLDDLGLTGTDARGVDILGHSMGGMVVMRWALANPNRFRSLVLMDTSPRPFAGALEFLLRGADMVEAHGLAALAPFLGADLTDSSRHQVLRQRLQTKHEQLDAEAFIGLARDMGAMGDLVAALCAIHQPTTVIVGENDTPFIKPSHAMHDAIAGSELVVVPGCGHCPNEEDPQAWLRAMEAHLARVVAG